MSVAPRGAVVKSMLAALEEVGPMTACELCEYIGTTHSKSARVLSGLTRASVRRPKRVHIKSYVFDAEGARRYPRAVYAIGDLPDTKKPKSSDSTNAKRWREKKKVRVNSVWALALNVKERLAS